jgi:hypothetical protein
MSEPLPVGPEAVEPLSMSFDVECSAEHAFTVWTERISSWWPTDHSVSGQPDLRVVIEGRVGGRVYERTAAGVEHDWGEVTAWEPPTRLSYLWHLMRERADATEVSIRFVARGSAVTRIEIEHRGWEQLGASAGEWRQRNRIGWDTLLAHYINAVSRGEL